MYDSSSSSTPLVRKQSAWRNRVPLIVLGSLVLVLAIVLLVSTSKTTTIPSDDRMLWPGCSVPITPAKKMNAALRAKLLVQLQGKVGEVAYLRGAVNENRAYTDTEADYHQESNFLYASGYAGAGVELVLLLNSTMGSCILFVDDPTSYYAIWNGVPLTLEQIKEMFDVDQVMYKSSMLPFIQSLNVSTVHTLPDTRLAPVFPFNSTAERAFTGAVRDTSRLRGAFNRSRLIKTEQELQLLRIASLVSVSAHRTLMQSLRPPMNEYQAQALFEAACADCGLREQAYPPIMGSGPHSAILHYNANDKITNSSELMLVDAAGQYRGYCSDITRTFPLSGTFTPAQRQIYELVLAAQTAAIAMIRPGMLFSNMSLVANIEILNGLSKLGLIRNGTLAQYLAAGIHSLFLPHGLGHGVGLDVHDGVPLQDLQEGVVLTVEPGIYFMPAVLQPAFNSTAGVYLNQPLLSEFMYPSNPAEVLQSSFELQTLPFSYDSVRDGFVVSTYKPTFRGSPLSLSAEGNNRVGGVRIEDVLLVTHDGFEYLSKGLPRTSAEVEQAMAH